MNKSPSHSNGTSNPAESMNRQGRRIQEIVAEIDEVQNPAAHALLQECMESTLAFYGEGLARMLEVVKRSGIGGQKAYDDLINDPVVRGLLLIHGLHPHDLVTRLHAALEKVRPYMQSHGGDVELLDLADDIARLRLRGSCQSCPSSAATLELAVRHALEEACPDLAGFEVDGATAARVARNSYAQAEWIEIADAEELADGEFLHDSTTRSPLFVARVDGRLYAYEDRCPACNAPLHLGALRGGVVTCSEGHPFDVVQAGRSPDDPALHLAPFPLIEENGTIKAALAVETEEPATAAL